MWLQQSLLVRQTYALTVRKNWIVLRKHWFLNLFRCFIGPIAFAAFLAAAQVFLIRPNTLGLGSPAPIYELQNILGNNRIAWTDTTNGTSSPSPDQIMQLVTRSFSPLQLSQVTKANNDRDLLFACPANFNGRSNCFAAITFKTPDAFRPADAVQYLIRIDAGSKYVNVDKHTSDFETRVLPLQWVLDSAVIELQTGVRPPLPREWPFTKRTNEEQRQQVRRSYVRGIDLILVIGLWICFSDVVYHLAGAFASERASQLTVMLHAMGCLRPARMISWILGICIPYIPAWIIMALVWRGLLFTHANVGLLIGINLVTGFSLASWALLISTPFGKSPQLAAIITTAIAFILAILALVVVKTGGLAIIFTFIFPPTFFIFAIRAVSRFEIDSLHAVPTQGDPARGFHIAAMLGVSVVTTILFPILAMWLEHLLFDAKAPSSGRGFIGRLFSQPPPPVPHIGNDVAIHVENLTKFYKKGNLVKAIENLSLTIPRNGVFVLLGSNGSGKSTFNGIISNIISPTSGTIAFANGASRPPRGALGIVPQTNVLFNELTCVQTVRLWSDIKRPAGASVDDIGQLLTDCDLASKLHKNSGLLSGGQKRKLQLAIGLVGGSELLLVDEATSGVDPLSRRAIWRAINAVRHDRTVVFTTHFLDEADLLADNVAILAAPGKLLAHGSPVILKSTLGRGYIVNITLDETRSDIDVAESLGSLRQSITAMAPLATMSQTSSNSVSFALRTCDTSVVASLLSMLEKEMSTFAIKDYDTHGTSLEEVFLELMNKEQEAIREVDEKTSSVDKLEEQLPGKDSTKLAETHALSLSDGQRTSAVQKALVVFHKRWLIARRSWLTPLLAFGIAVCASCISLALMRNRNENCETTFEDLMPMSLSLPTANFYTNRDETPPVFAPSNLLQSLGNSSLNITGVTTGSFEQEILNNYRNIAVGGISVDLSSRDAVIAHESSPYSTDGPVLLNTFSNIVLNSLRSSNGINLIAELSYFPSTFSMGTANAMQWATFFGLGLGLFPAFAVLYVTTERINGVKSMQLSNGMTPLGLHLGHLLAELPLILLTTTVITIIFAAASSQFLALGYLWLIMTLYCIAATLFSFIGSLFLPSPIAAFAAVGAYNVLFYVIYLSGYMITLTYAPTAKTESMTTIVHFTLGLLGPIPSLARGAFISVNLFSLLCSGQGTFVGSSTYGQILKFGGPILYLIIYIFLLFGLLIWIDSGYPLPLQLPGFMRRRKEPMTPSLTKGEDVLLEEERVKSTTSDPLRLLHVSKRFKDSSAKAVDDVSFGVGSETLALLGPNGAGKTTTFNIIRGGISPDEGDVVINGTSIDDPSEALLNLGLCPQFSAIDAQLTVREHLRIYGKMKGLRGQTLDDNITLLLDAATLNTYADRLAIKLSGGNQRKLSLAIALIGNPDVLLIDEYSTGIDAATKRQMWKTLRRLAQNKAVVLTTHSLEEAVALSQRVAILAGRLLAIGTIKSLLDRYPTYEIHLNCRTPEEVTRARQFVGDCFPDSTQSDDVATRWEVPVREGRTLADLFRMLSQRQDFPEYTVERLTLESVFLKVLKENEFTEESTEPKEKRQFFHMK